MLNGTGDEKRNSRKKNKHSNGNEQEIQEIKQKFKEHKTTSFFWVRGQDLNLQQRNTNPLCYHYTTPQDQKKSLIA